MWSGQALTSVAGRLRQQRTCLGKPSMPAGREPIASALCIHRSGRVLSERVGGVLVRRIGFNVNSASTIDSIDKMYESRV